MRTEKRKIPLILDNAPTHCVANLTLSSIRLLFLPTNTTSVIQPLDAGIIAAFKKQYRSFHIQHALIAMEEGQSKFYKVDILQTIRWCKEAWSTISPVTVVNFWHYGKLVGNLSETRHEIVEIYPIDSELTTSIAKLPNSFLLSLSDFIQPACEQECLREIVNVLNNDVADNLDNETDDEKFDKVDPETTLSAFRIVTNFLNQQSDIHTQTIEKRHHHTYHIVSDQRQKRLEKLQQSDIRSYFPKFNH